MSTEQTTKPPRFNRAQEIEELRALIKGRYAPSLSRFIKEETAYNARVSSRRDGLYVVTQDRELMQRLILASAASHVSGRPTGEFEIRFP